MAAPARVYRQVARASAAQETERKVLEAATRLFAERYYDEVRLEDLAALSGVTVKTLQRRFGNKEGVARAFILGAARHNAALRDQVPAGDAALAIDFVVGMYEAAGDMVMRTLSQDGRVPVVTEMAEAGRALHEAWLKRVFAPLLSRDPKRREAQLALLLVATDVYSWKLLRRDRRLSRARTLELLRQLVDAALLPVAPHHPGA